MASAARTAEELKLSAFKISSAFVPVISDFRSGRASIRLSHQQQGQNQRCGEAAASVRYRRQLVVDERAHHFFVTGVKCADVFGGETRCGGRSLDKRCGQSGGNEFAADGGVTSFDRRWFAFSGFPRAMPLGMSLAEFDWFAPFAATSGPIADTVAAIASLVDNRQQVTGSRGPT